MRHMHWEEAWIKEAISKAQVVFEESYKQDDVEIVGSSQRTEVRGR